MSQIPPVSLLVPCHNGARFLPHLDEQTSAQTRPFAEKILFDDGSGDGTAEAARNLGFTVLRSDANRGPAFARNRLLEAASCSHVHFHDVDDGIDPSYLEKVGARLEGPDVAALCGVRFVVPDGRQPNAVALYGRLESFADPVEFFIQDFVHLNAFIFPREFLLRIGGFFEGLRLAEDRDLQARAAHAGLRFRTVDEPLVTWVRHARSTFGGVDPKVLWDNDRRYAERVVALGPQYRSVFGRYWFDRAWREYLAGTNHSRRNNLGLAKIGGVTYPDRAGWLERALAPVVGAYPFFALRRMRMRLRKQRLPVG